MDQYAAEGVSWNLAPGPAAIPTNLEERSAELWASPPGFIKAALANHASVKPEKEGTWVTFDLDDHRYEGRIDSAGDVAMVRTFMDSPVLGDTPIEWRYSAYRDFEGVRFPARIEQRVAGLPWYELSVGAVRINTARPVVVPPDVATSPTAPPRRRSATTPACSPATWPRPSG